MSMAAGGPWNPILATPSNSVHNRGMRIVYDPDKNERNAAKHGVALEEAAHLDWDTLWATEDRRSEYGEPRMIGYALMGDRLYCVVYTDRGSQRRIISLRKANNREIRRYAGNHDPS